MKTKYPSIPNKSEISKSDLEKYSDAVSALCNLGIQKNDAHNNVSLILKKDPEITLSDLITKALQMRI